PQSTPFPYTTLFRSTRIAYAANQMLPHFCRGDINNGLQQSSPCQGLHGSASHAVGMEHLAIIVIAQQPRHGLHALGRHAKHSHRSEEHTSELQSREN